MPDTAESTVHIHPAALCESSQVGAGSRIWAFAHVLAGAVIGRDCNICDHVYIEGGARIGDRVTVKNRVLIWEGVTIEDDVFIGPGVIFTNDRYPRSRKLAGVAERYERKDEWLVATTVRRGASIGAGAIILCGLTVGQYAGIGAGAVVTRDVPDHCIAVGNPARVVGWACICGVPLNNKLCCPRCERLFMVREGALVPREKNEPIASLRAQD